MTFQDGTKVPNTDKAEYLGGYLNEKSDPMMEVNRRIGVAAFARKKLEMFWKRGTVSKRKRLLMYDAIVGSKLTYALHTLPIPERAYKRLDAFYFKGLRQIMGWTTTYGQMQQREQKTNTNVAQLKAVNNELKNNKKLTQFKAISTRLQEKSHAMLGEILRRPEKDPVRETLISGTAWNLLVICRVGRPRVNWIIETAKSIWDTSQIYKLTVNGFSCKFNHKDSTHVEAILSAAQQRPF